MELLICIAIYIVSAIGAWFTTRYDLVRTKTTPTEVYVLLIFVPIINIILIVGILLSTIKMNPSKFFVLKDEEK